MTGPLLLPEVADLVGGHRWLEDLGFATLGRWSTDEPDPAARVVFAGHSRHHGERAAWWRDRFPAAVGFDPDASIRQPVGDGAVDAAVADLSAAVDTGPRVAAARNLILTLRGRYRAHLDRCREAADGEVRRTLVLAIVDLDEHLTVLDRLAAPD